MQGSGRATKTECSLLGHHAIQSSIQQASANRVARVGPNDVPHVLHHYHVLRVHLWVVAVGPGTRPAASVLQVLSWSGLTVLNLLPPASCGSIRQIPQQYVQCFNRGWSPAVAAPDDLRPLIWRHVQLQDVRQARCLNGGAMRHSLIWVDLHSAVAGAAYLVHTWLLRGIAGADAYMRQVTGLRQQLAQSMTIPFCSWRQGLVNVCDARCQTSQMPQT